MDINITVKADELANAINNLAEAVKSVQLKPSDWMEEHDLRQKSAQNTKSLAPEPAPETAQVTTPMPEPIPAPDPQPQPHTRAQLTKLCEGITNLGTEKTMQLITILSTYGVQSIPALPDDKIEEFYKKAEALL